MHYRRFVMTNEKGKKITVRVVKDKDHYNFFEGFEKGTLIADTDDSDSEEDMEEDEEKVAKVASPVAKADDAKNTGKRNRPTTAKVKESDLGPGG